MKVESKLVSSEGLGSLYQVEIKAEEINKLVKSKLEKLQKKVKIKGFRAGKVPMSTIHKMYADDSIHEAANELIKKTSSRIVLDLKKQTASSPEVKEAKFDDQGNLHYQLEVELMPEIARIDLTALAINQVKTTVTAAGVEQGIDELMKEVPCYLPLEQARPAANDDLLEVAIQVFVNKKLQRKDASVEVLLGSGRLPKEVETALIGKQIGETAEVTIKIPAQKKIPAATSKFVVTVLMIKTKHKQQDITSLVSSLGLKDEAELKNLVKKRLTNQYDQITYENDHQQFLSFLEQVPVEHLPEKLVRAELENFLSQLKLKQEAKTENAYRPLAEKRVKLGILVASIANAEKVKIDPNEAKTFLRNEAMNYGSQAGEFLELMAKDSFMRNRALAPLIEQKVFETAKSHATIATNQVSEDEMLHLKKQLDQNLNDNFVAAQEKATAKES